MGHSQQGEERDRGVGPGRPLPRRRGIRVHRRTGPEPTVHQGIPVTTPACTVIAIAPRLKGKELERAVNEADKLDLIDPETLRRALDKRPGERGVRTLRRLLDHRTFTLTDSALEQRFLPIARRAGLPRPLTQATVNGFRVDFYWPDLKLVVETDGLRYHRTPAQQAKDLVRDQKHAATEVERLRFTHAQIAFDPAHVEATLRAVARRLAS